VPKKQKESSNYSSHLNSYLPAETCSLCYGT